MMNEMFDSVNTVSKNAAVAAKQLAGVNLTASRKLVQSQMELADDVMKAQVEFLQAAAKAKSAQDVVAQQVRLFEALSARSLAASRAFVELATETFDQVRAVVEQEVEAATARANQVVDKAVSAVRKAA
ncbi:MAG: TIGR01841 family phasin [Chromatiales bacterium]|nr:TIGR01841 family phasin [Chromatiales bacterium]